MPVYIYPDGLEDELGGQQLQRGVTLTISSEDKDEEDYVEIVEDVFSDDLQLILSSIAHLENLFNRGEGPNKTTDCLNEIVQATIRAVRPSRSKQ